MKKDDLKRILYLGPENETVLKYLKSFGDSVDRTEDKITSGDKIVKEAEFILSYGYRHIISSDIIREFERRIVNLHISYLPYNRGADPNLWSYLEDTPKGVTIHFIDGGIDTGDIIAQREVTDRPGDTLRTSYTRLQNEIVDLLREVWQAIRSGNVTVSAQKEEGTFHRLKDKKPFEHLLTEGWDTPVANLIGRALVVNGKETR